MINLNLNLNHIALATSARRLHRHLADEAVIAAYLQEISAPGDAGVRGANVDQRPVRPARSMMNASNHGSRTSTGEACCRSASGTSRMTWSRLSRSAAATTGARLPSAPSASVLSGSP